MTSLPNERSASPSAEVRIELVSSDRSRTTITGAFRGFREGILDVATDMRVPVASAVSVEHADKMFVGEILACWQEEPAWNVTVKVHDILTSLQSLVQLRDALLDAERISHFATRAF